MNKQGDWDVGLSGMITWWRCLNNAICPPSVCVCVRVCAASVSQSNYTETESHLMKDVYFEKRSRLSPGFVGQAESPAPTSICVTCWILTSWREKGLLRLTSRSTSPVLWESFGLCQWTQAPRPPATACSQQAQIALSYLWCHAAVLPQQLHKELRSHRQVSTILS